MSLVTMASWAILVLFAVGMWVATAYIIYTDAKKYGRRARLHGVLTLLGGWFYAAAYVVGLIAAKELTEYEPKAQ